MFFGIFVGAISAFSAGKIKKLFCGSSLPAMCTVVLEDAADYWST